MFSSVRTGTEIPPLLLIRSESNLIQVFCEDK